ncbi:hypothetical protein EUBC25_16230 [Claveliimonas bilis]|nr:hypothetical protein EUBC25_16230 [Claveliimonas bilis]
MKCAKTHGDGSHRILTDTNHKSKEGLLFQEKQIGLKRGTKIFGKSLSPFFRAKKTAGI